MKTNVNLSAYTGALCKNGFIKDLYLVQNNLIGTIPNELAWYWCCLLEKVVSSLTIHVCSSFFILQFFCSSILIIWQELYQVRLDYLQVWMSLALFGCFCDHCGCVSFVLKLYDCVILHSTDILYLFDNRLMGTVPSEIGRCPHWVCVSLVSFGCLSRDNCCGVFILLKYFLSLYWCTLCSFFGSLCK
jgi:hypothetical protein